MKGVRLAALGVAALLVLVLLGSLLSGLRREGPRAGPAADEVPEVGGERVRVEVLNAAGAPGLARAATDRLRGQGFDVVYYGNASGFGRDTSWVIDRVGRPEAAERVAEALGLAHVRTQVDTTLYLDVTVVLGRDWVDGAGDGADAADSATGRP